MPSDARHPPTSRAKTKLYFENTTKAAWRIRNVHPRLGGKCAITSGHNRDEFLRCALTQILPWVSVLLKRRIRAITNRPKSTNLGGALISLRGCVEMSHARRLLANWGCVVKTHLHIYIFFLTPRHLTVETMCNRSL